jgi:hypothetical protein
LIVLRHRPAGQRIEHPKFGNIHEVGIL